MKVGIMGLQGSGKTTIFNSLTGQTAKTGGYSSEKEIHLGLIKVPDERVDNLSHIFTPKKTTYSEITFADMVMPSQEKFSPKILEKLKYMEALVPVIKGFDTKSQNLHPLDDLTTLQSELLFSDFAIADNTLARLKKERRDPQLIQIMEKIHTCLDKEKPLRFQEFSEAEYREIAGFAFLSIKPALVVVNISESGFKDNLYTPVQQYCRNNQMGSMKVMGSLEEEISQLPLTEQNDFLREMGIKESARSKFIRESYAMMNLISFLTIGKDEVRSWTITRGTPAVKAAGKIHSDMERGFIRAEVVSYSDFIQYKEMAEVRKKGLMRLEGKNYQVRDGDIITFRFNV